MIITRTPFRMSFFGGGTDYPTWIKEHGGAVLSAAIDKYCYISLRYLPPFFEHRHRIVYSKVENVKSIEDIKHPAVRAVLEWSNLDKGVEIHHDGDLPARSGLGSSSAFTVGMINAIMALKGKLIAKRELAETAIYLEQEKMKETVGSQDQIAAAYGGLNKIIFHKAGTFEVIPILSDPELLSELQNHLMMCFTGVTRFSCDIAKTKVANFKKREEELTVMRQMVDESLGVFNGRPDPLSHFGKLLHKTWTYKRGLSDCVSSPFIDELYSAAMSAGALGGKVMGAGGGGFMVFFVEPDKREKVKEALNNLIWVPVKFDFEGSRVVLYQPNGF